MKGETALMWLLLAMWPYIALMAAPRLLNASNVHWYIATTKITRNVSELSLPSMPT